MTAGIPVVVLVSGRGSNLQALLDARAAGRLDVDFRAVISNHPGAFALERAERAGIAVEVVDHREHRGREAFDAALVEAIDRHSPALIVMAGFMRILTDGFIDHYAGRMLNIHPSLLPELPGLHTHERAIAAGQREHGATVHFVTAELDSGPGVIQARVPILENDTPDRLATRVLEQEHRIYPLAVQWFAQGRLRFDGHTAWLDGRPLERPVTYRPGMEDDDAPDPSRQ